MTLAKIWTGYLPYRPCGGGVRFPPGVKRPGHEAEHSPPPTAMAKNAWSCISTPAFVFMAWRLVKHRCNFTFTHTDLGAQPLSFPLITFDCVPGVKQLERESNHTILVLRFTFTSPVSLNGVVLGHRYNLPSFSHCFWGCLRYQTCVVARKDKSTLNKSSTRPKERYNLS
jgi:hypothetical protein